MKNHMNQLRGYEYGPRKADLRERLEKETADLKDKLDKEVAERKVSSGII